MTKEEKAQRLRFQAAQFRLYANEKLGDPNDGHNPTQARARTLWDLGDALDTAAERIEMQS